MKKQALEEVAVALAQAMQALADAIKVINEDDEPHPATRLYSYDDLAQILGKSKSTVRQWVCAGKFGEPVTVGSSTRITQAGLDKFIADHSGPTKKQPSKARTRTPRPTRQGQPLGI